VAENFPLVRQKKRKREEPPKSKKREVKVEICPKGFDLPDLNSSDEEAPTPVEDQEESRSVEDGFLGHSDGGTISVAALHTEEGEHSSDSLTYAGRGEPEKLARDKDEDKMDSAEMDIKLTEDTNGECNVQGDEATNEDTVQEGTNVNGNGQGEEATNDDEVVQEETTHESDAQPDVGKEEEDRFNSTPVDVSPSMSREPRLMSASPDGNRSQGSLVNGEEFSEESEEGDVCRRAGGGGNKLAICVFLTLNSSFLRRSMLT